MALLLFFGKVFPVVLYVFRLTVPFLSNQFGDFWVGKARMFGCYGGLVVLTEENKS